MDRADRTLKQLLTTAFERQTPPPEVKGCLIRNAWIATIQTRGCPLEARTDALAEERSRQEDGSAAAFLLAGGIYLDTTRFHHNISL